MTTLINLSRRFCKPVPRFSPVRGVDRLLVHGEDEPVRLDVAVDDHHHQHEDHAEESLGKGTGLT